MTISERLLHRWRKEALSQVEDRKHGLASVAQFQNKDELLCRILKMTQELLDQPLSRK